MKISNIFSDNMILQRGMNNTISGISEASEKITIVFNGESFMTTADNSGVWSVELPASLSAKGFGPYDMTITGANNDEIKLSNIMFGDVFLLGGQSNMELPINRTLDLYEDEVKSACDDGIRMFQVAKEFDFSGSPKMLDSGEWLSVKPETIMDFSAVGYFFAKLHREKENVPVGLVHTALGGAPVEALMSENNILDTAMKIRTSRELKCTCNGDKSKGCIFCYDKMIEMDKDPAFVKCVKEDDAKRAEAWYGALEANDPGLKNGWTAKWDDCDDVITVPGFFINTKYEKYIGSLWLQKTVNVPESFVGKEGVILYVGTLVDADKTYLNGELVGETPYKYPPRRYVLKKDALKAGENVISVRLSMDHNIGGAVPDMPYYIKCGDETVSIEGEWKLKVGYKCEPLEGETFFIWHPAALFNSMIAPLKGLSFKATLFYQGESNCEYSEYYADMLIAMVEEWRELFGKDMPFIIAEIPYFLGEGPEYIDNPFEGVRQAQHEAVKKMDGTYLAEIYDLGQYNELHPQNKKGVAEKMFDLYVNNIMEDNN